MRHCVVMGYIKLLKVEIVWQTVKYWYPFLNRNGRKYRKRSKCFLSVFFPVFTIFSKALAGWKVKLQGKFLSNF